ncbi:DnaJ domain-containing protein [Curvibacter sp. HBC61]|uniref:DnaJ domain-containing protein n=1 Tax=Curvibacter cyanobacteriorum TaxID=3026422 RepID=A0ABT5MYL8_9BURK|nr:DnaJ domain-containing protein [Curvibacter sp. HBC61]MDD0837863.1 DnaJ domain-containing protein [Curvibacter sp. HBC61]
MTHYETLGIDPAASQADIKAGFRRAAQASHPDREGGSDEAMAKVNRAYEVLSDPERRQKYDTTGDDAPELSQEDKAKKLLVELFRQALAEPGNIVKQTHLKLRRMQSSAEAKLVDLRRQVVKLEKRGALVQVSKGENLVWMLVSAQIDAAKAEMQALEDAIKTAQAAEGLLRDYSSSEEEDGSVARAYGLEAAFAAEIRRAQAFGFDFGRTA